VSIFSRRLIIILDHWAHVKLFIIDDLKQFKNGLPIGLLLSGLVGHGLKSLGQCTRLTPLDQLLDKMIVIVDEEMLKRSEVIRGSFLSDLALFEGGLVRSVF
jgi:hypothetical protein